MWLNVDAKEGWGMREAMGNGHELGNCVNEVFCRTLRFVRPGSVIRIDNQ